MESAKSNVIKSKSSNTAITKSRVGPPSPRGKKVRSSAEFQQRSLRLEKKRGVYVEKRTTKCNLNDAGTDGKTLRIKSPKRAARRNKTEFLQSVLNILSKCTTSTQHPDENLITIEKDGQTSSRLITQFDKHEKKRKKGDSLSQKYVDVNTIEALAEKPKYKSKILNKVLNNDEDLVILKDKINIIETPSNYSERLKDLNESTTRWSSSHAPVVNIVEEKNVTFDNFDKSLTECIVKENKVQINEPPTLVQITKEKSEHANTKAEKGLYNFFVDLLETVYDENDTKEEDPQVKFEIDERVADKLKVSSEGNEQYHVEKDDRLRVRMRSPLQDRWPSPSYTRCKLRNQSAIMAHMSRSRSPKSFRSVSRSIRSRSPARSTKTYNHRNTFAYAEQFIKTSPKSSVISRRKPIRTKKTLLNILKEKLMEDDAYEEPQNLYEALKVMARNKRKAKVIQFDEPPKYRKTDQPTSECWRRRRVISSAGGKCPKRKTEKLPKAKSFNTNSIFDSVVKSSKLSGSPSVFSKSTFSIVSPKPRSVLTDYTDSIHSIEVEEIDDFESLYNRNTQDIFYTERISSPSKRELETSRKSSLDVKSSKFLSAVSDSLLEESLQASDSYVLKSVNKFLVGL